MNSSLKKTAESFAVQQITQFGEIILDQPSRAGQAETGQDRKGPAPPSAESLTATPDFPGSAEAWMNASTLDILEQMICTCQKCPLGALRKKFVFGTGNPNADVVVIGEAPGADEDASGEPFVGMAGQLLTKILTAVNFRREDVFICNVLKCRPPGNRTPERNEVEQCSPYLLKQLDLLKPRFILALGLSAANTLLGTKAKMSELRGSVREYHGIPLIVTYHPAALLRNPNWKRATWEDVQLLRKLYDEQSR